MMKKQSSGPQIDDQLLIELHALLTDQNNQNLIIDPKFCELHNLQVKEAPGRNEVCPCRLKGGKTRYKNCCWHEDKAFK